MASKDRALGKCARDGSSLQALLLVVFLHPRGNSIMQSAYTHGTPAMLPPSRFRNADFKSNSRFLGRI